MQLTNIQKTILNYCIYCYGGSYKIEGNLVRIFVEDDEFYINVADRRRFGKYTIYHRNEGRHLDGIRRFHVQTHTTHLPHAFFICFTHAFNKKYKILNQPGDFARFQEDALKYNITF